MVRKRTCWSFWMWMEVWTRSGCWSWGWVSSWSRRWRPPWRNSSHGLYNLPPSISQMWLHSNRAHCLHLHRGRSQRLQPVWATPKKSSNLGRPCLPRLKLPQHHCPLCWRPQHGYHLRQCLHHGHQHHPQYPLPHLPQHHQERREVWCSASQLVSALLARLFTGSSLGSSLERILGRTPSRFAQSAGSKLQQRIPTGTSRSVCFVSPRNWWNKQKTKKQTNKTFTIAGSPCQGAFHGEDQVGSSCKETVSFHLF